MKLKILSVLTVMGMASGAFAQDVILDNLSNGGALGATTAGIVYENGVIFDGANYNLGVTVLGGPNAGSLSVIGTYIPSTDSKGYTGASPGQFQLGDAFASTLVPGVAAGGIATIQLQIWDYDSPAATGLFATYAAALVGNDWHATVTFSNPTSNPGASPPIPAGDLTGMPSVNLLQVPEPTTFAIAGLGIASLLAFRRRNA